MLWSVRDLHWAKGNSFSEHKQHGALLIRVILIGLHNYAQADDAQQVSEVIGIVSLIQKVPPSPARRQFLSFSWYPITDGRRHLCQKINCHKESDEKNVFWAKNRTKEPKIFQAQFRELQTGRSPQQAHQFRPNLACLLTTTCTCRPPIV